MNSRLTTQRPMPHTLTNGENIENYGSKFSLKARGISVQTICSCY